MKYLKLYEDFFTDNPYITPKVFNHYGTDDQKKQVLLDYAEIIKDVTNMLADLDDDGYSSSVQLTPLTYTCQAKQPQLGIKVHLPEELATNRYGMRDLLPNEQKVHDRIQSYINQYDFWCGYVPGVVSDGSILNYVIAPGSIRDTWSNKDDDGDW